MKRGSLSDIIDVNKETLRPKDTTLRDPKRYLFVWRFKSPYLVHCILLCK